MYSISLSHNAMNHVLSTGLNDCQARGSVNTILKGKQLTADLSKTV